MCYALVTPTCWKGIYGACKSSVVHQGQCIALHAMHAMQTQWVLTAAHAVWTKFHCVMQSSLRASDLPVRYGDVLSSCLGVDLSGETIQLRR